MNKERQGNKDFQRKYGKTGVRKVEQPKEKFR
jgi:hypothetical protein